MSAVAALRASRDPLTGETYLPPRLLSADGGLRECESVDVAGTGVLRAWTSLGDQSYGLVDLDSGLRLQVRLTPGHHTYGARYVVVDPDETRFARA